ncbi:MAG: hypothetical protein HC802_17450 [Caldilineaceae bacterium]|nr:hypothetical protein [Caldilineaceae bacterium]
MANHWDDIALHGVEKVEFPNTDHTSLLLEDENVEVIAATMRRVIDRWMIDYGQG